VRVDQKPITGTIGMLWELAGAVGLDVGVGVGVAVGDPLGVGVGPLTGPLEDGLKLGEGGKVGATVSLEVPTGDGRAIDPSGAVVGGVDDPQAEPIRATAAKMTSRVLTDRVMAVDLTENESAEGTKLADPTGFEPAISSVTGWHVGPLHHGSVQRR
jgi:hypothetical protein